MSGCIAFRAGPVISPNSARHSVKIHSCGAEHRPDNNATTYTHGSDLQIDHTVPVENVSISGPGGTQATRVPSYNDPGDGRTLVALDTHDNESKGDQDPTTWTPAVGQCRYVRNRTAVKTPRHLTVTGTEKNKLVTLTAGCRNVTLTVTRAVVRHK